MIDSIKIIFMVLFLIVNGLINHLSYASAKLSDAQYQKIFFEARSHINDLNPSRYYQLKAQLKGYSLYPYLVYLEVVNNFDDYSVQTIEDYLQRNKGTFWAKLLKNQWLDYLGQKQKWQTYLKFGSNSGSLSQKCWYARSLYENNQTTEAMTNFSKIWLYGYSLPDACDYMLIRWQRSKYDTRELRMERINLAIDAGEYNLARYLSYQLSRSDQKFIQAWVEALSNPQYAIKNLIDNYQNHKQYLDALVEVFDNYAYRNVSGAMKAYNRYQNKIPSLIKDQIISDIAQELAREHSPLAFEWLKKVPYDKSSSLLWQWRARTAILWQKWPELVDYINHMPTSLKNELQWQYWFAVGLYHTGDRTQANSIWRRLANERDYYGFLSADQLGVKYNFKSKELTVSSELLQDVEQMPEIQQIHQLYELGELRLASYYWQWLINRVNRYQALAAAIIANKWQIYSMSLYAYGRSSYYDNLKHRFPLAYRGDILQYANKYKLNPGWIWALTRQESHFHPEAVSSAGARGLMQLMPSTASYIASRYKIPYRGAHALFIPKVNIEIGVTNLSHVYNYFDQNMVLATSAYNAGYGNTKKWLPKQKLKAQRWVETVPFLETRNYIRNVLTYTVIYDNIKLNRHLRLEDIMKPVMP